MKAVVKKRISVLAALAVLAAAVLCVIFLVKPQSAQADFDADSYPPVINQEYRLQDGTQMIVAASAPGKMWTTTDGSTYSVAPCAAIIEHGTGAGAWCEAFGTIDEAIAAAISRSATITLMDNAISAYDFATLPGIIDEDGMCTILIDVKQGKFSMSFANATMPAGYTIGTCGMYEGVTTYTLVAQG